MRRKVLNQQQTYRLIREHIEIKIEEQQIKEGQAAFRRSILQHLAEEMRGEPTDLSTLDEGLLGNLFDKAKSFIGGSEKQQGALTRAVEKATDSKTQEFFQKLQKVSPGFPNTKGTDKFIAGLALLKATYQTLAQLAQNAESQVQRITAAAAASDIAAYAQDAVGDMSRTFKYFKEGEEEDLAEVDVRTPFGVGNKAKRALDKIIAQVKDGKGYDLADRDALQKHGQKLAAKIAGKGKVGKGSKFQDQTLTRIQDFLNPPADAKPNDPIVKAGRDITNSWRDSSNPGENPLKSLGVKDLNVPGGEDPELKVDTSSWKGDPDPDPDPDPSPEPYDPQDDIESGYRNQNQAPDEAFPESDPDTGVSDLDGDAYPQSDIEIPGADFGTSPVDPGEVGAAAAEGGSDMINVLGVPIATKLAIGLGLSVSAAVVGVAMWKTYKHLQKKKAAGDSREGLLRDTVKQLKPIQPKLDPTLDIVPGEQATQATTPDASQTAPAVSPPGAQQAQAPSAQQAPDTAQGTNARIGKQTPGTYHAQGQDQATQQGAAPELDSELGAQPAQKDGENDEAYASRLKMAAAARRRGVTEMKRLRQLAGLKILQS